MKIKFYFVQHIETKFFYLTEGQKEPSQKGLSKRDQAKRDQTKRDISKILLNLTT